MRRRIYLFIALAFVMAAIFSRLGFWQLARLHERQEYNRTFTRQLILQPVEFARLPLNPDSARFRGAVVAGTYDFDHELLIAPRTRRGSPGVEILTPLHRAGTDTVVLVDRGWVYSPDLGTVDLKRWREPDSAVVRGFVERYAPDTAVARSTNSRIIHRVSRAELASKLSDPVAPYYLIATGDTAAPSYPARRDLPVLDEGSHMNYAIQWFTFAAIALVGAGIVVQRERRVR
jgi:surfeit locus 1 family protein